MDADFYYIEDIDGGTNLELRRVWRERSFCQRDRDNRSGGTTGDGGWRRCYPRRLVVTDEKEEGIEKRKKGVDYEIIPIFHTKITVLPMVLFFLSKLLFFWNIKPSVLAVTVWNITFILFIFLTKKQNDLLKIKIKIIFIHSN